MVLRLQYDRRPPVVCACLRVSHSPLPRKSLPHTFGCLYALYKPPTSTFSDHFKLTSTFLARFSCTWIYYQPWNSWLGRRILVDVKSTDFTCISVLTKITPQTTAQNFLCCGRSVNYWKTSPKIGFKLMMRVELSVIFDIIKCFMKMDGALACTVAITVTISIRSYSRTYRGSSFFWILLKLPFVWRLLLLTMKTCGRHF